MLDVNVEDIVFIILMYRTLLIPMLMMMIVILIILLLITTRYINSRNRCDTIVTISCTSIDSIYHLHYLMY